MSQAGTTALERISDRINPILVKETRQAFKSKHFSITFLLSLAASLVVSFGGAALVGPTIDYQTTGPGFFVVYFVVLAFAIFLVVPFGAFRSLASEQEERTYELLSITTLSPGQIIWGKLLGAIVQMLIYYAAISPFLAFTFLLKGIDAISIFIVLIYSFFASVILSLAGLVLATLARQRAWQALLSVLMLISLMILGFALIMAASSSVFFSVGSHIREPYFWIAVSAIISAYISTFALMFQVSVSQLTFEADNRSTKIRIVVVAQVLLALGWIGWGWIVHSRGDEEGLIGSVAPLGGYLLLIGVFLAAEPDGMSRRVKRQIPSNPLFRVISALFFPGPGTGLALLLGILVMVVVMVGVAELTAAAVVLNPRPGLTDYQSTLFAALLAAYVFFYSGLGALLTSTVRRVRHVPALGGAALAIIVAALGSFIPNCLAMLLPSHRYTIYSWWQATDPVCTLWEIYEGTLTTAPYGYLAYLPFVLAIMIFILNLPTMGRAIYDVHVAGRVRPDIVPEESLSPTLADSGLVSDA